jgi:hypothetical protein
LRLFRSIPVLTLQTGYVQFLPVEALLQLRGAPEHPLYPFALGIAAVQAISRGERHVAETRCNEATEAARRLPADQEQLVHQIVENATSSLAFTAGDMQTAAEHMRRAAEIARTTGEGSPILLGTVAMYHSMAGDDDAAVPFATEGLARAREVGMPTAIAICLTALAGALADHDRERARALLRESLELEARLDYEAWAEITQAALISARLEEWDQALELASRAIRHLHWIGDRPLMAAMFNIAARVVALTDAEAAAVIQGAAYAFATMTNPTVTAPEPARAQRTDPAVGRRPGAASFVTTLRRETSGLLRDDLGPQRLGELRAEGQALDPDEAVAFALDAIAIFQRASAAQPAD